MLDSGVDGRARFYVELTDERGTPMAWTTADLSDPRYDLSHAFCECDFAPSPHVSHRIVLCR